LGESGVTTALSPSRIVRAIDGGLQAARCRVSGVAVIRAFGGFKRLIAIFEERHASPPTSSFEPTTEHGHSAARFITTTSDIPPIICQ